MIITFQNAHTHTKKRQQIVWITTCRGNASRGLKGNGGDPYLGTQLVMFVLREWKPHLHNAHIG